MGQQREGIRWFNQALVVEDIWKLYLQFDETTSMIQSALYYEHQTGVYLGMGNAQLTFCVQVESKLK